jgi:hypothetical protein
MTLAEVEQKETVPGISSERIQGRGCGIREFQGYPAIHRAGSRGGSLWKKPWPRDRQNSVKFNNCLEIFDTQIYSPSVDNLNRGTYGAR